LFELQPFPLPLPLTMAAFMPLVWLIVAGVAFDPTEFHVVVCCFGSWRSGSIVWLIVASRCVIELLPPPEPLPLTMALYAAYYSLAPLGQSATAKKKGVRVFK
jgi:hypothetical protein